MYNLIVRERNILAVVGFLDMAAGVIFLFLSVSNGLQKEDFFQIFFCIAVFGMMLILGIWMLMSYFLRRLCLGYRGCCYRTMFGRKREFFLRDIKKVERRLRFGEMTIFLWGENGKKLARIEMNMKNADQVLLFLKDYQLPAIEEDPAWKKRESWERLQEQYKKYKAGRYYPERQRNYRRVAEEEWKESPAIYQMPGEIKQMRLRARIIDIVGVIFAVSFWKMPREKAAIGFVVWPLFIFIFYLLYPRVLIWDINTRNMERKKEEYVQMPFLGLMATLGCGLLRTASINIEETWKAIVFEAALLSIFIGLLLIFYKKKRVIELGIPIFVLCMYCFISMYYWNCAFRVGEPEHIPAQVVEKRDSGEGGSSRHSYYFTLRDKDGEEKEAEVVYRLYERTEVGDSVLICRQMSAFGIHYYYVHL